MGAIHFWDMDHTLIDNDCDVSWKEFLIAGGLAPASDRELIDLYYEQYTCNELDEAAFNVGTGVETSVLTIFRELARLTGFSGEPRFAAARPGEVRRSALDGTRAAQVLGFTPAVSLGEGLARTVDWLRSAA